MPGHFQGVVFYLVRRVVSEKGIRWCKRFVRELHIFAGTAITLFHVSYMAQVVKVQS